MHIMSNVILMHCSSMLIISSNELHNYAYHKQCNPNALHNYAYHKQCNANALHNYADHKQFNSNALLIYFYCIAQLCLS